MSIWERSLEAEDTAGTKAHGGRGELGTRPLMQSGRNREGRKSEHRASSAREATGEFRWPGT